MDFNFVDIIILLLLVYFIWQGYQTGFIGGVLNIISTIISFAVAILFYPNLAKQFENWFGWSDNLALVAAFFVILIILELVLSFIFHRAYAFLFPVYKKFSKLLIWDKVLGIIPSVAVGLFLVSIFLLLPLILPVRESMREAVSNSWWGNNVLNRALTYQSQIEGLLDRLPYKNLAYIITPQPLSDESVQLNFPEEIKLIPDPESEKAMFDLVNQERSKRGIGTLTWDTEMRDIARDHCLDMFERGYFSHYSPEGESPFDRMDKAGAEYKAAGENLAYAPNVKVAHQGLMESQGHRENILRPEFGRLGVGVIDGGINGKMFCQEFRD